MRSLALKGVHRYTLKVLECPIAHLNYAEAYVLSLLRGSRLDRSRQSEARMTDLAR